MKNIKKKFKIAIVSDAIYPYNKGGKEKRIHEISSRLAASGHEVHIYCMKWWKGKEVVKKENGVTLHALCRLYPLYSGDRRSIKQALVFALSCFKLLNESFDFIEADHMPHLVLFPLKIVTLLKKKKLVVVWNEVWGRKYWIEYLGIRGNLASFIEKISILTPDEIISVSNHTATKLVKELAYKKKLTVIPNGIDYSDIKWIKSAKEKSDIIYAGRLLRHKNIDVLIRAIKILSKNYPEISCIIIGEGPERLKLGGLVKSLNLEKNIKFLNFLSNYRDLYSLFKSSKVFVLPSEREGFGIVVLEANASGIPVITTSNNNNAARHLITEKNGMVVKLSEFTIARAAETLLKKNINAESCIKFAKKYDWSNIVHQVELSYMQ